MNSEKEKHLFSLLLKDENNENVIVPSYPRLKPESIKLISKKISKLVYDSLKNESSSSKNNRDAIIGLLSKWSKNNIENHVRIDKQNRDIIIKCLSNTNKNRISDPYLDDFFKQVSLEITENNLWCNIYTSLERANDIYFENKTAKDMIEALDSMHLQNNGFICTVPNKLIQKNDFDQSINSLKIIIDDNSYTNSESEVRHFRNTNSLPALAYALLNMERNDINNNLLIEIIEELIKKPALSEDEYDLLYYIWINEKTLQLPDVLYEMIISSCQFLYEKLILEMACEVLSIEDPNYDMIIKESNLLDLIKSKKNKIVYCNILSCLYELFNLSNYDVRISNLLFAIKKLIFL